ncbi:uncharacterized protein LOC124152868 isoform X1 [Haliotis rufescens]|uniref:uncharacterized protein LOC124152868 isoform X1 n=1 Tax=Haliotis rufescens TaxID=6454 RepID=UPI00201F9081|nr:uncharacterized protein LOC124152868 isoform X1 [Haliotis rufescens]XP_048250342.1 uncharacterized protein LOC124152868 isoform X1 [Haliotis rufescens]XP_048250343.1 uncharacterized protein LOC124152868 isoform X1 [Haliotis rufescens]XP_048250344.1 uncharacterized protein LOC124152868 isoform X1 [Haliotis rufescens]XP_048250345.1 uncharacterized protein LOC124152868 isoform X1 [Haliotis rufescens]XP_048250346.1 uncharacterized protein LOC124152868 isoform X1 [Haliotis rufescens]
MGHLTKLTRKLSRRKGAKQGQTECPDQTQLTRKQKRKLDRQNRTQNEVKAEQTLSCEPSDDSDLLSPPVDCEALTDTPTRQRAHSAGWLSGHDVDPRANRTGSYCCHAHFPYHACSQSVPDMRQTDPPVAGPTKRWESDPGQINVTGVSGGAVDTSYAAGITSGPAHQGNVIVNNYTRPTEAANSSDKDTYADEDPNDGNTNIRNELKRTFMFYKDDFEHLLQQAAGILLLYIILPLFVLGCMTGLTSSSPLIKFGVLVLAVFVSRFTVVHK